MINIKTPIGIVQIINGKAMATNRIGECKNGQLISTPDLSDAEIERAGITGKVNKANELANRLYK